MRRLRLLTAGESHGPAVSGILEGLPAGMRVSTALVDRDLRRRQHGYGSGRRMTIERDRVIWTGGLRYGRTLGSPLSFRIDNLDWAAWQTRMSVEPVPADARPRPVTMARPGHADFAGAIKYATRDVRDVLERASARSTAPRVLAGAVCRQLLSAAGIRIWSFVDQLGRVRAFDDAGGDAGEGEGDDDRRNRRDDAWDPLGRVPPDWPARDLADPSPLRCPDPVAERRMVAEVDAAARDGDSVGGAFVVVAEGTPIGLGSSAEWDTRLDGALAAAIMAIPAVKAVAVGDGFEVAGRRGSEVHDEFEASASDWSRRTNRAGGLEGGMSNGMPIVLRAAVKPVSTLRRPLTSVDLADGQAGRAHIERTDIAIMPRAAIVGEAMVALVLADALLTSFGGDTMGDLLAAVRRRRRRSVRPSAAADAAAAARAP